MSFWTAAKMCIARWHIRSSKRQDIFTTHHYRRRFSAPSTHRRENQLLCKEACSEVFSPHLLISFNLEYRANILESGPESVVDKRKQDGPAKHRRRPVHGCGSYRGGKWPKCKEPDWC